jgi:hypothetical protein
MPTVARLVLLLALTCLVFGACGRRTDDALITFLQKINYFGGTREELAARLGEPDVITLDADGRSVTRYYYPGLEATFDNITGDIIILSVTDAAWVADSAVGIGSTKAAVDSALGEAYCRLSGDGGEARVYFCPRPSGDVDARRCDCCRVCYIFLEADRVKRIVWSTVILDSY